MTFYSFILSYLLCINSLAVFLMYRDKVKAIKGAWRIQEKTLFIVALCGGAIGIFIGSHLFRHKTQKKRFKYGIPLILLLQLIIVSAMFFYS